MKAPNIVNKTSKNAILNIRYECIPFLGSPNTFFIFSLVDVIIELKIHFFSAIIKYNRKNDKSNC